MSIKDLPAQSRPRERLLERGAGALSDVELLALLLRTGRPGQDVLAMSAVLLAEGGLQGLLFANVQQLQQHKGLGPAKQTLLLAVSELMRRALAEQLRRGRAYETTQSVCDYFQLMIGHCGQEVFAVMFLDSQQRLIACEELFRGTLTQTSVYPREVVRRALELGSASVVLAHNHPSGEVRPSYADEALTKTLKSALALVDVQVLDHVIVGQGRSLSMARECLL